MTFLKKKLSLKLITQLKNRMHRFVKQGFSFENKNRNDTFLEKTFQCVLVPHVSL